VVAVNPYRGRAVIGATLYALLMAIGAAILLLLFVIEPLSARNTGARLQAMELGALLAFPPLLVYLWVPWIIDRFDPEPWWCLALVLLWGGVAAAGFSGLINSGAVQLTQSLAGGGKEGASIGEQVGACVSAPLTEEFWKGLAVFGIFYFVRREFDGMVDGIIYGTFAALGFAATENVTYYARAQLAEVLGHQHGALSTAFLLRGVLSPWGHPLYTSMIGIGFGLARETERASLRWIGPLLGYLAAVLLHAVWNAAATISGMFLMLMLPLWFLFICGFFGIIVWLVMRKGRIIRENLHDEMLIGSLSREELALICSPIGLLRAAWRDGGLGRRFVACGSRLGLCKWHAARAIKGDKQTISSVLIAPLRQELARLRRELYQRRLPSSAPPRAPRPVGPPRGYGHDPRFHPHDHRAVHGQDLRGYPQHPSPYPPDPKRVRPPGGHRR
jgi:RsiW-degrading membrane proteinase PrsW (M82 family)